MDEIINKKSNYFNKGGWFIQSKDYSEFNNIIKEFEAEKEDKIIKLWQESFHLIEKSLICKTRALYEELTE